MPTTNRITYAILALTMGLALLLVACREPAPTPTPPPPPTPTPTPTPTPEPTGLERLAWFNAPPDTAHWIAWAAMRRIAAEDETLGDDIAALPWVADRITAEEAGALDDISWLLPQDRALTDMALDFDWMGANGAVTPEARRLIRAIRAANDADDALSDTLASYDWISADPSDTGVGALETIVELAAPGYRELTATGIGAIRFLPSSGDAPETLEFATSLSQLPWMTDNVTSPESKFITDFSDMIETSGSLHADALNIILAYDWVQDGIAQQEADSLALYEQLFKDAGAEDAEVLPIMLEYEWVADTLRLHETRYIRTLASLLRASSSDDVDLTPTMVSYQWIMDSITTPEKFLLDEFADLLQVEEPEDSGYRRALLNYGWLSDEIVGTETAGFRLLSNSIKSLLPEHTDALDSVFAYEWLHDDIRLDEAEAIRALEEIIAQYDADTKEFIVALLARPWLQDGVGGEQENWLLDEYRYYLTGGRIPGVPVPPRLATYPWLDNGINDTEFEYVRATLNLLQNVYPIAPETTNAVIANSSARPVALEEVAIAFRRLSYAVSISRSFYSEDLAADLARMPWLLDGIERLEGWWLDEYATLLLVLGENQHTELAQSILERPWARDGISADEREWTHQYRRLLEETTGQVREDALKLPDLACFQDRIGYYEAALIGQIALLALHNDPLFTQDDWFQSYVTQSGLTSC